MRCSSLAPPAPPATHDIESLLGKASLVAHLLTGSIDQAEAATMAAIESWDPRHETEDALYQKVLHAAARTDERTDPDPDRSSSPLPIELRAVLNLETNTRRCYVLHILVGMSVQACAGLLRLSAHRVRELTCAGLKLLSRPRQELELSSVRFAGGQA